MNKKILTISLVLILIICNSMTVLADTTWDGTTYSGENTQNVTAKFVKDATTTYDVTIMWGELSYTYAGTVSWDSGNGVYNATDEDATDWILEGQENTDDTITVTNASDKKVKASFSFVENSKYIDATESEITGTFNDGNGEATYLTLGSAAIADSSDRIQGMSLALSGYPMGIKPIVDDQTIDIVNNGTPIGTVTVTLEGID